MKNTNNSPISYLALILVLSFILLHKIKLVFIGVIISLYTINKNYINNIIKIILGRKEEEEKIKVEVSNKKEYKEIELNKKDYRLTLVESIEELGFIPSLEKNENSDTA